MQVTVPTFVALVVTLFIWIFILVDICRNEFAGSNKNTWLLLTLFIPIVGILLYLTLGRKQRVQPGGWGASANLAGIITVPLVAALIVIYRFLASQDLP